VSYPYCWNADHLGERGKIIRRFPTEQSFYSWTFYAQGKTGGLFTLGLLHGELKSHCELHDATRRTPNSGVGWRP